MGGDNLLHAKLKFKLAAAIAPLLGVPEDAVFIESVGGERRRRSRRLAAVDVVFLVDMSHQEDETPPANIDAAIAAVAEALDDTEAVKEALEDATGLPLLAVSVASVGTLKPTVSPSDGPTASPSAPTSASPTASPSSVPWAADCTNPEHPDCLVQSQRFGVVAGAAACCPTSEGVMDQCCPSPPTPSPTSPTGSPTDAPTVGAGPIVAARESGGDDDSGRSGGGGAIAAAVVIILLGGAALWKRGALEAAYKERSCLKGRGGGAGVIEMRTNPMPRKTTLRWEQQGHDVKPCLVSLSLSFDLDGWGFEVAKENMRVTAVHRSDDTVWIDDVVVEAAGTDIRRNFGGLQAVLDEILKRGAAAELVVERRLSAAGRSANPTAQPIARDAADEANQDLDDIAAGVLGAVTRVAERDLQPTEPPPPLPEGDAAAAATEGNDGAAPEDNEENAEKTMKKRDWCVEGGGGAALAVFDDQDGAFTDDESHRRSGEGGGGGDGNGGTAIKKKHYGYTPPLVALHRRRSRENIEELRKPD